MSDPGAMALSAAFTVTVGAGAQRAPAFSVSAELSLERGVLVLFGPSGAGKSLTLQALGGLLRPSSGYVRAFGEVLHDSAQGIFVPPERRRIGYVPQVPSLFPHLSVEENVAFGLPWRARWRAWWRARWRAQGRAQGRAQRWRDPEVATLMEELGIAHRATARPASLSGGERQRVALARALLVAPRLLLLDEPFASIDQEGRAELREVLRAALARHGIPAVLVTHDPEEALVLGDTLVRFERGRTVAQGAPAEILRQERAVVVTGVAAGPATAVGEGRVVLSLREARVEGPAALLGEGGVTGEQVVLRLSAPRG
ncbi:ATP-binding cassette domain-containing protein [Chondromyces apiculatus]|uniref:Molybdate ABC transporter, ATPase subunit n=1 Tax=Chondromyces apiculatus DSM 436 TaxID=1192034 RepID=A0A017STS2_9BACT|nr:ATP-binding cassette domain-containing protein [Chondromyces apiculatus]EYF00369.1 molybdate ABC transporter, ATPase subunit [Chondromyces apiculatus DSM 436]